MKLTQYRCDVIATFGSCGQPCPYTIICCGLYTRYTSVYHSRVWYNLYVNFSASKQSHTHTGYKVARLTLARHRRTVHQRQKVKAICCSHRYNASIGLYDSWHTSRAVGFEHVCDVCQRCFHQYCKI